MNPTDEPARLFGYVTGAVTATVGVLTIVGVWSPEVGGAITTAAAAWIMVAAELIRDRVTPTAHVALTKQQAHELARVAREVPR